MFGSKKTQRDLELFTIYDSKTKTYGQPTFAINQHDLIRQVVNMFSEPEQQTKNALYLNAEDFSIFKIGTFDKSTGTLETQNLEVVANMHDLRAMVETRTRQTVSGALLPT